MKKTASAILGILANAGRAVAVFVLLHLIALATAVHGTVCAIRDRIAERKEKKERKTAQEEKELKE